MTGHRTHATRAASLLGAAFVWLAAASAVAAADDYTLPFFDPNVGMSYGVDRDSRVGVQLDYTGTRWWDGTPHWGRVYDNHTGIDYPMALRSDVAAAKGGTVIDVEGGFGTQQFGNFGNFVRMSHADGRQTLYYHLASAADGGIVHQPGKALVAGAMIGRSGCSGLCHGAHLHFEVLQMNGQLATPIDPNALRLWTTWPGRVPFLAAYVRENNAGTEVVRRGQTITHWVEFRNIGGRTWKRSGSPGRIALLTWDPAAHASPFRASDWSSSSYATAVDQASVSPDGVGRFTFGIRGGPPAGRYRETFNLVSISTRWFDHDRLGGFYVPIYVSNFSP